MAIRGTPMVPSAITRTVLCIHQCTDAEYTGELYNPYMPEPVTFHSIREMIDAMETFFDGVAFPQAFCDLRSFDGPQPPSSKMPDEVQQYHASAEDLGLEGRLATFLVQVQFRQNATWQGQITWVEQHRSHPFRSMLEMLRLLTDALERTRPDGSLASWKN